MRLDEKRLLPEPEIKDANFEPWHDDPRRSGHPRYRWVRDLERLAQIVTRWRQPSAVVIQAESLPDNTSGEGGSS